MDRYYKIYYTCGCGKNEDYIVASSDDEADNFAYTCAIENYESYAGMHGIVDIDQLAEEEYGCADIEELDEDSLITLYQKYNEIIEENIDYGYEEISREEYNACVDEIE